MTREIAKTGMTVTIQAVAEDATLRRWKTESALMPSFVFSAKTTFIVH